MTLSRDEKVQEARRLRGEGLTYEQIGARLGVTGSAAWGYCNPERLAESKRKFQAAHPGYSTEKKRRWRKDPANAERDREHSRAWKARNVSHLRAYNDAYARNPEKRGRCESCRGLMGVHVLDDGICSACIKAEKEARWEQIEKWWAEGLLLRDISERLGVSMGWLAQDIHRMRSAGRNVPYRRAPAQVKRIRAGARRGMGLAA